MSHVQLPMRLATPPRRHGPYEWQYEAELASIFRQFPDGEVVRQYEGWPGVRPDILVMVRDFICIIEVKAEPAGWPALHQLIRYCSIARDQGWGWNHLGILAAPAFLIDDEDAERFGFMLIRLDAEPV